MNIDGFKKWLEDNNESKHIKLISDCVSRAQRVEKAFQFVNPSFSFDNEFQKDKGIQFIKLISRRGVSINAPVPLPIGTNQMDSIVSATKKYFAFLSEE